MRLIALCALLCACGDKQAPSLWKESPTQPTDKSEGTAVDINVDAIDAGKVEFKLDNKKVSPRDLKTSKTANGTLLRGKLDKAGSVVAVRVGKTLTGVIRNGRSVYEIVPVPGGHRVVPVLLKKPRDLHGQGWAEIAAQRGPRPLAIQTPPVPSTESIKIDVLFAYTKAVLDKRTLDGVKGLADVALTELNDACVTSNVNVEFRNAGLTQTTGTETGKDMNVLYHELLKQEDFLDAHAKRKELHADILVLLVDQGTGPLGLGTIMGEPTTAVAVVDQRDSLLYLTIAHEIGHIMGALHDVADDWSEKPFPYGHGYLGAESRTIMATPCAHPDTCPIVVRWSAPPELGSEDTTHDARVLRETAAAVAAFGDQL
jgi:hypothetical protein